LVPSVAMWEPRGFIVSHGRANDRTVHSSTSF
jgi:hypothetical protein